MKTFEQLQQEYPGTLFHEYSRRMVKGIQLDAAKWGMEQAAEVAAKSNNANSGWMQRSILAFGNNLTIDQLPK